MIELVLLRTFRSVFHAPLSVRSQLTVIPQDPLLFHDSLRSNLDPTGSHEDRDIWNVLEMAQMKSRVKKLKKGLQHHVEEGETDCFTFIT